MTTRKPAIKGTPEERRELRKQVREFNRANHVRTCAREAGENGRRLIEVACDAAKAASKRITNDARKALAREIAEAVQRADVPENRKEAR